MIKTISAGGIVINPKGQIILVKDEDDIWMFPKGHKDEGEEILATAKREIFEETGISKLLLAGELESYERYSMDSDGLDDLSKFKTIKLFLFKTEEEDLVPQGKDIVEAKWFDIESAITRLTSQKDKEVLIAHKEKIENL